MQILRKKNSLLQKEINSRRSDQNIDDLRMTNFSMKQKSLQVIERYGNYYVEW